MALLNKLEMLKDMIQTAIDNGARTVEDVHKSIAYLPFEILEKNGLLDEDKQQLRERSQQTIGTVYGTIREINQKIGELASDMFEAIEDSQHVSRVMDENDQKSTDDSH